MVSETCLIIVKWFRSVLGHA